MSRYEDMLGLRLNMNLEKRWVVKKKGFHPILASFPDLASANARLAAISRDADEPYEVVELRLRSPGYLPWR